MSEREAYCKRCLNVGGGHKGNAVFHVVNTFVNTKEIEPYKNQEVHMKNCHTCSVTEPICFIYLFIYINRSWFNDRN